MAIDQAALENQLATTIHETGLVDGKRLPELITKPEARTIAEICIRTLANTREVQVANWEASLERALEGAFPDHVPEGVRNKVKINIKELLKKVLR